MSSVAFKEWAVICEALASGRQSIILRKGGIAEAGGEFKPEHDRFWLFPTYLHQQMDGIRPDAKPLLEKCMLAKPPGGMMRIRHYAEIRKVVHAERLPDLLELGDMHIWSPETVEKRFHYRKPGLFVLIVQAWELPEAIEIANQPGYEGCRTWVPMGIEIPSAELKPCTAPAEVDRIAKQICGILHPCASA